LEADMVTYAYLRVSTDRQDIANQRHGILEYGEQRYGPYAPIGGPIPLHRYRRFKKTRGEKRADRIEGLAEHLALPRAALSEHPTLSSNLSVMEPLQQPFRDADPYVSVRGSFSGHRMDAAPIVLKR
jgi:hypothetical protein